VGVRDAESCARSQAQAPRSRFQFGGSSPAARRQMRQLSARSGYVPLAAPFPFRYELALALPFGHARKPLVVAVLFALPLMPRHLLRLGLRLPHRERAES